MAVDEKGDLYFPIDEEAASANTVRGLRIFLFYVLPALVILFVAWRWIAGLFWPLLTLSVIGYFAWRFRDLPALRWVRERTWDVIWNWALNFGRPKPSVTRDLIDGAAYKVLPSLAWASAPADDEHAWYRAEYERTHKMLANVSRNASAGGADEHERRKLLLYNAEMHDALLVRGDSVPLEYREPSDVSAPPRSLVSSLLSSASPLANWQLYALGASLAFGGFQFVRAEMADNRIEKLEDVNDELRADNDQQRLQIAQNRADYNRLHNAYVDSSFAFEQAAKRTAETNARIAQRNANLERRLRQADEQTRNRPAGAVDYTERLRLLESTSAGTDSDAGTGDAADSGL